MSVNKAIIIGRLGQDPQVSHSQSGSAVAKMSVATDESWKDKDGNRQEKTEWHRVVAFGRTAELCGEYLKKGREVYVEGSIQTREWEDKEGQRRWTTEIKAQRVNFLGGRQDDGGGQRRQQGGGQRQGGQSGGYSYTGQQGDGGGDIPF